MQDDQAVMTLCNAKHSDALQRSAECFRKRFDCPDEIAGCVFYETLADVIAEKFMNKLREWQNTIADKRHDVDRGNSHGTAPISRRLFCRECGPLSLKSGLPLATVYNPTLVSTAAHAEFSFLQNKDANS